MNNMPLVSVIMGAYNCEETVGAAIDSIIEQTYTNWELIVCDDASSDRTLDVLMDYAKKDSRIRVLHNEMNLRLAASLNKCLAVSKGSYIARMDADDESLPDRLKKQVQYLEKHSDIDCVGCNRMIFDENGDIGVRKSVEQPTKNILKSNTPFAHPTIMMKKIVYDVLKGYSVRKDTMRAEDLDLWIRFYAHDFKGYNIQEVLYRYRESLGDLKKRSLRAAIETSKVYLRGYKLLNFSFPTYLYALKPIVASIIPNRTMMFYHRNKLSKKNEKNVF